MRKLCIFFFCVISLAGNAQDKQRAHTYGVEVGFNQYTTPPIGYQDLTLDFSKSMFCKLNVLGFGINLWDKQNKNGYDSKVLFLSLGTGLKWNNYRFDKDVRLSRGQDALLVYRDTMDRKMLKSKLTICWLNIPVMLEYQFNKHLFIMGGAEFGVRINDHAKYAYKENNDKKKEKDWNNFRLNNTTTNLSLAIGFGPLSLCGSYCLTPLFQHGKGPVIYPYTINLMYSIGNYY